MTPANLHHALFTIVPGDVMVIRFAQASQLETFRVAYPDRVRPIPPLVAAKGYWGTPYVGEREDLSLLVQCGGQRLYPVPTHTDHEVPY